MGFTVQRLPKNDPASKRAQWAVVLDNEHVMFVGDYQQCEEWLDFHELVETTSDTDTQVPYLESGPTFIGRMRNLLHIIAARCHFLHVHHAEGTASPTHPSVPSHMSLKKRAQNVVRAFLTGDAGHCGTVEIVAAALLVAVMYVGTMFFSLTIAWDRAVLYSILMGMPSTTRSHMTASARTWSTSDGESLDIACDLATPELQATND